MDEVESWIPWRFRNLNGGWTMAELWILKPETLRFHGRMESCDLVRIRDKEASEEPPHNTLGVNPDTLNLEVFRVNESVRFPNLPGKEVHD